MGNAAQLRAPEGHYRTIGVLRSEWTKLRSVRSTVWTLLALVVLTIGIGALVTGVTAAHWSHRSLQDRLTFDPTSASLAGTILGELAIGVLGVLVVTAEHGTGAIRSTLAAVPKRPLVLGAKVVVFGIVALIVAEIAAFAAYVLGQYLLAGEAPHTTLAQSGVLRAVVFDGLYVMLVGLLALGIGAIIRHTAGAIASFVGILLVLPAIVSAFPSSFSGPVGKYMVINLGGSMASVRGMGQYLDPGFSLFMLCVYVVGILLIATWTFVRRDA